MVEAACWPDDIKLFGFTGTSPWHTAKRPLNMFGYTNITAIPDDDRVDWAIQDEI